MGSVLLTYHFWEIEKLFFFTGFCQIFYLFIYFSHLNLIVGVDLSLVFCIIYEGEKQFFEKNR